MGASSSAANAAKPDSLHSPGARGHILLVGNDAALLSYREQVLRSAGWMVISRSPDEFTSEAFANASLCIACHTLSREERFALLRNLQEHCPGVRFLAITSGNISRADADRFDGLIDNLEGPTALIREVQQQLARR